MSILGSHPALATARCRALAVQPSGTYVLMPLSQFRPQLGLPPAYDLNVSIEGMPRTSSVPSFALPPSGRSLMDQDGFEPSSSGCSSSSPRCRYRIWPGRRSAVFMVFYILDTFRYWCGPLHRTDVASGASFTAGSDSTNFLKEVVGTSYTSFF